MGKKVKEKQNRKGSKKGNHIALGCLAAVLIVGWVAWSWFDSRSMGRTQGKEAVGSSGHVRREMRTPLSPALFVGQTARAYQVAHEIPEVLDQLYCYCQCDKHLGHKSLLSCFTDTHGAT
jgi:hypothetical protein